ncbi:MAG: DNA translocase FtsK [Puniceicoccales bacterium]|jgi:S-DNA-T family DNA segregation ATPase FtsK/SpoIIIE|nr:DNA translocase FtsK [Puniceicoccales bacterium]
MSQPQKKCSRVKDIVGGTFLFVLGLLTLIWLLDFDPDQSWLISTKALDVQPHRNMVWRLGPLFSFWIVRFIGLASLLVSGLLIWFSFVVAFKLARPFSRWLWLHSLCMILSLAGLLSVFHKYLLEDKVFTGFFENKFSAGLGGIFGLKILNQFLDPLFGPLGGFILLLAVFLVDGWLIFRKTEPVSGSEKKSLRLMMAIRRLGIRWLRVVSSSLRACCRFVSGLFGLTRLAGKMVVFVGKASRDKVTRTGNLVSSSGIELPVDQPVGYASSSADVSSVEPVLVRASCKIGDHVFPSTELLERGSLNLVSGEDHESVAIKLVSTLAEFGVSVKPSEIHRGPVITRYEILPEPGVRVEKIVGLDKNIALGLAAKSVRIIAPVPGKGCVGVELPNKEPVTVRLREILESRAWAGMRADIPIVLGRGVTGEPIIADLARMPHLLIAGATGSGKTVCINAIIASLLFHASPDALRFIMVDPKIVEMQTFNDLPHMLIPVVTDPKKVPNALKWLIAEMEDRYQIFAKVGVRNIASFNAKVVDSQSKVPIAEGDESHNLVAKKMPYIVCIIDELADLMMVAPGDIETCIARLAQLARAAGIHLILATQRPSVNVITGIIKANLPSRIAFKVASKVDSRTILDIGGAESLLGQGDMLFLPPGSGGLLRAQGALVSDDEINALVRFLYTTNGAPKYEEAVQERIETGDVEDGESAEDWDDDMIPKALEIIRSNDRASTSFLQRKLKIGYNRAARIMDTLREKGLVSSAEDSQDGL